MIGKLNLSNFIQDRKCAFLCGNGFSLKFDNAFGKIYDNLYPAHKDVIYKSKSNTKFMNKFAPPSDVIFWYTKEYFNLTIGQTVKLVCVNFTLIAIFGLLGVLTLSLFV